MRTLNHPAPPPNRTPGPYNLKIIKIGEIRAILPLSKIYTHQLNEVRCVSINKIKSFQEESVCERFDNAESCGGKGLIRKKSKIFHHIVPCYRHHVCIAAC